MSMVNKILQYIYYIISLVWLVWGTIFFFFKLEAYHRTFIVAIYGLILTVCIAYLGFLHSKTSNVRSLLFPIISSINFFLVIFIILAYYLIPEHGGLGIFMLLVILGLTSLTSLCAGTFEVEEVWRKSVPVTITLIITSVVWTFIFTTF
jgi:hypothetical protein